ncbi:MAG: tetratricopeptide repeat protein, partial [Chloroflexi bacterium]|nr:tetratricopeptide repeat protein [Chloroflexota bacterium]
MTVENKPVEKTRQQLVNEINTARQAFEARPSQAETCYQLAQLLFQAGDFWEAQALLQPHRET